MARKTHSDLSLTPIQQQERRVVDAEAALQKLWRECDRMMDKSGDNLRKGVTMATFNVQMAEISRAQNTYFHAFDALTRMRELDKLPSKEPPIPVEDLTSVIIISMDDKKDELEFNINFGLLSRKLAEAIAWHVSEDTLVPPLCEDHR
jgi:hypothetical protein